MNALQEVREGDWMQTYGGRAFYPIDPRPEEIFIEDIAGALSKTCRFGGHCLKFYSVAEHCVHVAAHVPRYMSLTALLHDASEAYIADIIRPLKPYLHNYYALEETVMEAVVNRYGLLWPMPAEVKRVDNALLAAERDQIMAHPPRDWGLTEPALGVEIKCWSPNDAFSEFVAAFHLYGGK